MDGCYELWPNARNRPASGPEQAEVIIETARGLGIGATVHVPNKPWKGNEVGKRNFITDTILLQGELYEDWMIIIDSDEVIDWCSEDFKQHLADTDLNVASYSLFERFDHHANETTTAAGVSIDLSDVGRNSILGIQRLLPGLRCQDAHYLWCWGHGADTSYLWGRKDLVEEYLPLDDYIRVEHRHLLRGLARNQAAKQYYLNRDAVGAEFEPAYA